MAKKQPNLLRQYLWILLLTVGCFLLALPSRFTLWGVNFDKSRLHLKVGGKDWHLAVPLQLGLDLAGGVQYLHDAMYEILEAQELKPQKGFQAIYKMILGQKQGPRAASFLLSLDKDFVVKRLRKEA